MSGESMIERVARALCALDHDDMGNETDLRDQIIARRWPAYERKARAALTATAEPTDGMIEAGRVYDLTDREIRHVWGLMLESTLSEAHIAARNV